MLDRSIPYWNIVMNAPRETLLALPDPALPAGFALRPYQPGDAPRWARLEWLVGEFSSEEEALAYFEKQYGPHMKLLQQRCWFVWDVRQEKAVATATAWFDQQPDGARVASLHWVSTDPAYQGRGLGRAVTAQALRILARREPSDLVYLHTQTWSHKAVSLYLSLGFGAMAAGSFAHYKNDYPANLPILREKMRPTEYETLLRTLR